MFGIHDLPLFILSGLLLNMAPGPDSLLIMSRSATQGWRAGSAAALGIGAGTFIHVFAAAMGLSALLAASSTAFSVIKYAGAAYLFYFGLSLLLSREKPGTAEQAGRSVQATLSYRRIFVQGFFTNVLNPKVALFFLAFVPQFIAPQSESKTMAFIVLGCIFNFNAMLWCNVLAISSAFASRRIKASRTVARWLNRSIGVLFASYGVRLALMDHR